MHALCCTLLVCIDAYCEIMFHKWNMKYNLFKVEFYEHFFCLSLVFLKYTKCSSDMWIGVDYHRCAHGAQIYPTVLFVYLLTHSYIQSISLLYSATVRNWRQQQRRRVDLSASWIVVIDDGSVYQPNSFDRQRQLVFQRNLHRQA